LALACVVTSAISAAAQPASVDASREPIRVQMRGEPECFDAERFFNEVSERTDRVRPAAPDETARMFVVGIHREVGGVVGTLVLVDQGIETKARVVPADNCEEALTALAVIAALALDPSARATSSSAGGTLPPVGDPASIPASGPVDSGTAPSVKLPSRVSPSPMEAGPGPRKGGISSDSRQAPVRRAAYGIAHDFDFVAGASVEALAPDGVGGPGSGIAFGVSTFVGFAPRRPGVLAPDLRLSAARSQGGTATTAVGTGTPVFVTADAAFCPLHAFGNGVSVCSDVQAGVLELRATGPATRSVSRAWVAPGAAARLAWPPLAMAAGVALILELEIGLRVPLLRDTFYFLDDPGRFGVYGAPPVVARSAIHLGLRFW
jgi:hypothetical protein